MLAVETLERKITGQNAGEAWGPRVGQPIPFVHLPGVEKVPKPLDGHSSMLNITSA